MSHDQGYASHPEIPVTTGISPYFKLLVVGGMLLAIMQGFFVADASAFGRVWPAENSAKVPLPPFNP